jgi:hypothetical protein
MAAADVDLSFLWTQAGVPEDHVQSAIAAPTPDVVKAVLSAVVNRLRDLEQNKFQLEIELEAAIRGAESRCEQFKASTDKALKDVEEVRQKLQDEGTSTLPAPVALGRRDLTLPPSQKPPVDPWRTNSRSSSHPDPRPPPRSRPSERASPLWRHPIARPSPLSTPRPRPMPTSPMSSRSSTRRSSNSTRTSHRSTKRCRRRKQQQTRPSTARNP